MTDPRCTYNTHRYTDCECKVAQLKALNAELLTVLAEYVVLGAGKCTISKAHADKGLSALTKAVSKVRS